MDSIRQLLARVNTQLSVLNRSQQMVIGLCAVVIAGSLLWLMQWSASPEYVSLPGGQSMSMAELSRASEALKDRKADHRVIGDGIFVRAEDRYELMNELNSADALPQTLDVTFASLMQDESPFRPESENIARRNWALGSELAKIIAASPDVESATVIVNPLSKRTLGAPRSNASASVSVSMEQGKSLTDERVRGIARLVAGAVAGLEPHMVAVVDNATGRPWVIPSPEDDVGFGLLEERKKTENHILAKIIEQLSYIPGVLVAVSAELEADQTDQTTTTWDKPEVSEESSTETETSAGSPGGEAGTNPNVGTALTDSSAGQRSTSEVSKIIYQPANQKEEVRTRKGRLTPKRLTAAINVPRSFVASICKATNGLDKEPVDADLEVFKTQERDRIQKLVQNVLMSKTPDDVQVDFYYDLRPDGTGFSTSAPSVAMAGAAVEAGIWSSWTRYIPQAGLGLLGLIGILMMTRMVRGSAQTLPSRAGKGAEGGPRANGEPETVLSVGGGPVGLAEVSDGYLTGHEIDEATLRESEFRRQVSKLVNDDPHNAADLVRRWVEQPD